MKRVRITSKLASAFWGHPMSLGAVVLCRRATRRIRRSGYPVVYTVGHFSERAPFGFTFEGCDKPETAEAKTARLARTAREPGCELPAGVDAGARCRR